MGLVGGLLHFFKLDFKSDLEQFKPYNSYKPRSFKDGTTLNSSLFLINNINDKFYVDRSQLAFCPDNTKIF